MHRIGRRHSGARVGRELDKVDCPTRSGLRHALVLGQVPLSAKSRASFPALALSLASSPDLRECTCSGLTAAGKSMLFLPPLTTIRCRRGNFDKQIMKTD